MKVFKWIMKVKYLQVELDKEFVHHKAGSQSIEALQLHLTAFQVRHRAHLGVAVLEVGQLVELEAGAVRDLQLRDLEGPHLDFCRSEAGRVWLGFLDEIFWSELCCAWTGFSA